MKYFIDLFSPNTAKAFANSSRDVSGFRISRKAYINNQGLKAGDIFICYCTKIQRFIGVLEVVEGPYVDNSPLFVSVDDQFILRFKVNALVWLPFEQGIPIHEDRIWTNLSFTKGLGKDSSKWTYKVFSSPMRWDDNDGVFLMKTLLEQAQNPVVYPLTEIDIKKLRTTKTRTLGGESTLLSVPDDEIDELEEMIPPQKSEQRESIKVQAKLAKIGETLGFKIWLPKSDRSRVLEFWTPQNGVLLEELPLVFEETTLDTIKNIDVLWVRRRSIVRAFEVEGTTSIYSGILRMADLLSLQPMLDIKIHIVAAEKRRDDVFEQIQRPVFAFMERGPLSKICSYISYDSVDNILNEKLSYMTDAIVGNYEEWGQE